MHAFIHCVSCQRPIFLTEENAGRKVRCDSCGASFVADDPDGSAARQPAAPQPAPRRPGEPPTPTLAGRLGLVFLSFLPIVVGVAMRNGRGVVAVSMAVCIISLVLAALRRFSLLFRVGAVIGLVVLFVVFVVAVRIAARNQAHWQSFTLPEGGCRVRMPGTPEPRVLARQKGDALTIHVVEGRRRDRLFAVCAVDIPAGNRSLKDRCDAAREEMLAGLKDLHLVFDSDDAIEMEGHPGRESLFVARPTGALVLRVIAVGDRLYALAAGGRAYQRESQDLATFFHSFELTADNPAGAKRP